METQAVVQTDADTYVRYPGITVPGLLFEANADYFAVSSDQWAVLCELYRGPAKALVKPCNDLVAEFSRRIGITDWHNVTPETLKAQFGKDGKRGIADPYGAPCSIVTLLRQLMYKHLSHIPPKLYSTTVCWFSPLWAAGVRKYGDNREFRSKESRV